MVKNCDMGRVWCCNEWDPLEEVIVGNPANARYPTADRSAQVVEFSDRNVSEIPDGRFPDQIIDETEEDLQAFIEILRQGGVTVRRPSDWDHAAKFSTLDWEAAGYYNYCPRDVMLVLGDRIIEAPSVIRSRWLETFSYREILVEYLKEGARWFSAPRPQLRDSIFEVDLTRPIPRDEEPVFDAANVLRMGQDLVYLVSTSGNELGGRWLESILGDEYRVHYLRDSYNGSHIDSTLVALRPGLLLCNPARISDDNLPDLFQDWEKIYSPPMVPGAHWDESYLSRSIGSEWIDMNLFSLDPNTVVVDRDQGPLIKLLESYKLEVVPAKLRHARMLGGGFHCVTLDIRRRGGLESYFESQR